MPENTAPTPAPAPDPGPGPERGPGPEPGHAVEPAGPPPAVRAQLLATEHWSLLASRSTTQSEVLTRISMFLTLTSAGLLSLALVRQATGFTGLFPVFELSVLGFVTLVGVLTQVRVMNVGIEDLMYVIAMNRIRAGYLGLDPGLAPYLMSSPHDDRPGSEQTYFFFRSRRHASQFLERLAAVLHRRRQRRARGPPDRRRRRNPDRPGAGHRGARRARRRRVPRGRPGPQRPPLLRPLDPLFTELPYAPRGLTPVRCGALCDAA